MPSARDWHWVDFHTLERNGIKWRPARIRTGRYVDPNGYVKLSKAAMSEEEIRLATECGLFLGRSPYIAEHRLVAAKKYGGIPSGSLVRHVNGIKTDNRPENLVLGTIQENNMDHDSSRRMMLYWKDRCRALELRLQELESQAA